MIRAGGLVANGGLFVGRGSPASPVYLLLHVIFPAGSLIMVRIGPSWTTAQDAQNFPGAAGFKHIGVDTEFLSAGQDITHPTTVIVRGKLKKTRHSSPRAMSPNHRPNTVRGRTVNTTLANIAGFSETLMAHKDKTTGGKWWAPVSRQRLESVTRFEQPHGCAVALPPSFLGAGCRPRVGPVLNIEPPTPPPPR